MQLKKSKIWLVVFCLIIVMLAVFISAYSGDFDLPKDDEVVICFTTAASYDIKSDSWQIPLAGRIFEPEEDSALRNMLVSGIINAGEFDESESSNNLFKDRVRDFLADNESGKRLNAIFGKIPYQLSKTGMDGTFNSIVKLNSQQLSGFVKNGWINYKIQTRVQDNRQFGGKIKVVRPGDICVISDIDDTIKLTGVTDRSQLMKKIFYREYCATEGMLDYYQKMEKDGYNFFYVSASPVQLYRPLSEWMHDVGYPEGEINLRDFYIADSRAINMLRESGKVKQPEVEAIIRRFPGCKFILIGDAGEQDARIYADVARKFAGQILKIQIRALTLPDKAEYERLLQMAGKLSDDVGFDVLWQGEIVNFQ